MLLQYKAAAVINNHFFFSSTPALELIKTASRPNSASIHLVLYRAIIIIRTKSHGNNLWVTDSATVYTSYMLCTCRIDQTYCWWRFTHPSVFLVPSIASFFNGIITRFKTDCSGYCSS